MNLFINFISHVTGLCNQSSSTESDAICSDGKSVNRFVSRICFGNSGKNFKNKLAPAIENIFPKFALVATNMYFNVLMNVLLPSFIPDTKTFKLFSNKTIDAASFAVSAAVSTDIPTSACFIAGASFIPSPIYPTISPACLYAKIIFSFWFGLISAKISMSMIFLFN